MRRVWFGIFLVAVLISDAVPVYGQSAPSTAIPSPTTNHSASVMYHTDIGLAFSVGMGIIEYDELREDVPWLVRRISMIPWFALEFRTNGFIRLDDQNPQGPMIPFAYSSMFYFGLRRNLQPALVDEVSTTWALDPRLNGFIIFAASRGGGSILGVLELLGQSLDLWRVPRREPEPARQGRSWGLFI